MRTLEEEIWNLEENIGKERGMKSEEILNNIWIEIENPPYNKRTYIKDIGRIDDTQIESIVAVEGTILRCSAPKTREIFKDFQCSSCKHIFKAYSLLEDYNQFKLPVICNQASNKVAGINKMINIAKGVLGKGNTGESKGNLNCTENNQSKGKCKSTYFLPIEGTAEYEDYQEIRIQNDMAKGVRRLNNRTLTVILRVWGLGLYIIYIYIEMSSGSMEARRKCIDYWSPHI